MKDPTAHQNVLFPSLEKLLFESDTIFDESGRIILWRGLGNGRKT